MVLYKVEVKPMAVRDIDGYHSYYLERTMDIEIANSIVSKIDNAIQELKYYAGLHQVFKTVEGVDVRKVLCGDFVVLYTIQYEVAIVLRVFHGKMDYGNKNLYCY